MRRARSAGVSLVMRRNARVRAGLSTACWHATVAAERMASSSGRSAGTARSVSIISSTP